VTSNHLVRTLATLIASLLAGVMVVLLTVVASLFLYVASVPWEWLRVGLALIFAVAAASLVTNKGADTADVMLASIAPGADFRFGNAAIAVESFLFLP
jgi:hypothetical protein